MIRYKPLHFLCVGVLLYLLVDPGGARHQAAESLSLEPAQVDALRAAWQASVGRLPDSQEMDGLIRRELDDEILLREALSRSLHLRDPVVKQRLALNMRFLGADQELGDDELFTQALDLGMERNDVVVRRRLVQVMEMSITDGADREPVTEDEYGNMYERRKEELVQPARFALKHVYFSRDRRPQTLQEDAEKALKELQGTGFSERALRMGDPFLGGHRLPLLSEQQLAGQFGNQFAVQIVQCELRRWCGPVQSSYGLHLVWIGQMLPSRLPGIDEPDTRKRLRADVLRERQEKRLARAMASLRSKYGVQS